MSRKAIYVGTRRVFGSTFHREVFRSSVDARMAHPVTDHDYLNGPFQTMRAAKFAVHFNWTGNPHYVDVQFCERQARAKRCQKQLKRLGSSTARSL